MAFGLDFINDIGHTVISEETYNPTLVGKATYISTVTFQNYMTVPLRGATHAISEHKFQIACASTPMPFVYVPQGVYFSLAGIESAGVNLWNIYVDIGVDNVMPEVYVFASMPPYAGGGFGLALYGPGGEQVFHSDLRHLAIQQVVLPVVPVACNRTLVTISGVQIAFCSASEVTGIAPPPDKAAVFCPSHGVTQCPSHNSQLQSSECCTGSYMISGTTLTAAWAWIFARSGERDFFESTGSRAMLIIDGALYD